MVLKPVSLTAHRNTAKRRKAKLRRAQLLSDVKRHASYVDPEGYAIVVWDKEFTYSCVYDVGSTMPGSVAPEFVKQSLLREIHKSDAIKLGEDNGE